MAKIAKFEELLSWKKARELANFIYDLTECPNSARDVRLKGQVQDAASSVMHNIAEGFDSGTNAEFIRFLKIARRSASEVHSELYLALDRRYVTEEELAATYALATDAKKLINGMIGYLRRRKAEREPTT